MECCPCAPPGHGGSCIPASLISTSEHFFSFPMYAVEFHSRDPAPSPVGHASTPASPAGCTCLPQQVQLVAPVYPSRSHWLHMSTPAGPTACTCLPQQVPLITHTYPNRSHWLHTPTPAGPTGYTSTPGPIGYTHLSQQVPLVTHVYPRSHWLHTSTPAGPTGYTHLPQQVHWLHNSTPAGPTCYTSLPQQAQTVAHVYSSKCPTGCKSHWMQTSTPAGPTGYTCCRWRRGSPGGGRAGRGGAAAWSRCRAGLRTDSPTAPGLWSPSTPCGPDSTCRHQSR